MLPRSRSHAEGAVLRVALRHDLVRRSLPILIPIPGPLLPRRKALRARPGQTPVVLSDSHPFPACLDVRNQHDGNRIWSMIPRFCSPGTLRILSQPSPEPAAQPTSPKPAFQRPGDRNRLWNVPPRCARQSWNSSWRDTGTAGKGQARSPCHTNSRWSGVRQDFRPGPNGSGSLWPRPYRRQRGEDDRLRQRVRMTFHHNHGGYPTVGLIFAIETEGTGQ